MRQNEERKPIKEFPDYEIDPLGQIFRRDSGRKRKLTLDGNGYFSTSLRKPGERKTNRVYIHQLVLQTFVGDRPKGTDCRHLNGIKTDNRLVNLKWGTRRENVMDAFNHGNPPGRKRELTEDIIKKLAEEYIPYKNSSYKLAKTYGFSQNLILKRIKEYKNESKS